WLGHVSLFTLIATDWAYLQLNPGRKLSNSNNYPASARPSIFSHHTLARSAQHHNSLKLSGFFSECYCRYTRRGSSVVEQPIRNRQVASSTLALGSKIAETSCRLNRLTMPWPD